jgi:hypothetical protein
MHLDFVDGRAIASASFLTAIGFSFVPSDCRPIPDERWAVWAAFVAVVV